MAGRIVFVLLLCLVGVYAPPPRDDYGSQGGYGMRNDYGRDDRMRDWDMGGRYGMDDRMRNRDMGGRWDDWDDNRGGYDDRRGGYDDWGRGGYDDRRGGYDDRRGGHDDRRGGRDDRRPEPRDEMPKDVCGIRSENGTAFRQSCFFSECNHTVPGRCMGGQMVNITYCSKLTIPTLHGVCRIRSSTSEVIRGPACNCTVGPVTVTFQRTSVNVYYCEKRHGHDGDMGDDDMMDRDMNMNMGQDVDRISGGGPRENGGMDMSQLTDEQRRISPDTCHPLPPRPPHQEGCDGGMGDRQRGGYDRRPPPPRGREGDYMGGGYDRRPPPAPRGNDRRPPPPPPPPQRRDYDRWDDRPPRPPPPPMDYDYRRPPPPPPPHDDYYYDYYRPRPPPPPRDDGYGYYNQRDQYRPRDNQYDYNRWDNPPNDYERRDDYDNRGYRPSPREDRPPLPPPPPPQGGNRPPPPPPPSKRQ